MIERRRILSDYQRVLLLGTGIGALVGLVAALVVAHAWEERQQRDAAAAFKAPGIGDIVKFAISALMLVRQLGDLLTPKD
jgi:hypothetical protein